MLRYYSYYSVGGYKDLYLGDSSMTTEYTYFLPLLGIQRKKAQDANDEKALTEIEEKDKLPKIGLVTNTNSYGLPQACIPLISHGGYKLIFTHAGGENYALVLRDIEGNSKDENGRQIPFLIMVVADTLSDAKVLSNIASYWANHLNSISNKISACIEYDRDLNGIRFDLRTFNALIKASASKGQTIKTTKGEKTILAKSNVVGCLIVNGGINRDKLKTELGLTEMSINAIPVVCVFPLDDKKRTSQMLEKMKEEQALRRRKIAYYALGGIAVLGMLAYMLSDK